MRYISHKTNYTPLKVRPVPWKPQPEPKKFVPLGKSRKNKPIELLNFGMFPEGTVNTNEGTSGPVRNDHGFLSNWVAASSVAPSNPVEVIVPTELTQQANVPQTSTPVQLVQASVESQPSLKPKPISQFIWVLALSGVIAATALIYPKSIRR